MIAHYDPCSYPDFSVIGTGNHGGSGPQSSYEGWIEDTWQDSPSSTVWGWLDETLIVPPAPMQNGATIYYFAGLTGGSQVDGIIQPVLQYGISPAGGGNYWAIASWWWGSGSPKYHTPLTQVSSGDSLAMLIGAVGPCNPNCGNHYAVLVEDESENGFPFEEFFANGNQQWTEAVPAVLEADNDYQISYCDQAPPKTQFQGLQFYSSPTADPWTSYTLQPYAENKQFPIETSPPHCGWVITFPTQGSTTLWDQ